LHVIAETERLRIRLMTLSDAAFVCRLLNEPSWLQNIGDRGVRSVADAASYIESKVIQMYTAMGFGMYVAESKADSAPIGICGLVQRPALPAPDIGFAFMPEFWGKGYAREAATAVMRHSRKQLGLDKLLAIVTPSNERSCRLLEALGFVLEGEYRAGADAQALKLYAVAFRN
jgi:[ribosomal protein S5]-alanine N-acetyltransferase